MHSEPLQHTQKGRERVLVAISWDERSDGNTMIDKLKGTNQQHDLDLACFVFDDAGQYIDFVGSMAQDGMDSTGCIYHSGDDATGAGDGDDESISVELAGLPESTTDLFFVVEVMSDHNFTQIDDPTLRIADGATNNNMHEFHMAGGGKGKACIAARISRDYASPTGWTLYHIGDFPDLSQVSDWGSYLTRYL